MRALLQALASSDTSKKRGNMLSALLIVVSLGTIIGLVLTMMTRNVSCPDELIGVWRTAAPGYEDGRLVITKNALVFSAGADHVDGQAIRRLEAIQDGSRTLYVLVYGTSRGDEQILSFYYHPLEQTITFKNQTHLVWIKKSVES